MNIRCDGTQRFLSIGETSNHLFQLRDEPSANIISPTSITSKVEIQNKDVEKAFEILVKHHPLAQCTIDKNENGDFYFQNINDYAKNKLGRKNDCLSSFFKIKFSSISRKGDWVMEAYNQMKTCFQPGDLLWKAVWLKIGNGIKSKSQNETEKENYQYTLLFLCHHSAFDGKVAFQFIVNQFFSVLNSLLKNGNTECYLPKENIFPKSYEEIFCDFNKSVSEQSMYSVMNTGKTEYKNHIPIIKTYTKYEEDEIFTKIHSFLIDKKLTSKAVNLCKSHKVSVNSFLLAILSAAIELTRSEYKEFKEQVKKFVFPIDFRKFNKELSKLPMSLGCFYINGECTLNPLTLRDTREKFIEIAKEINMQVLQQNKADVSLSSITSLLPLLTRDNIDNFIENIVSATELDNIPTFSNIGVCKPIINEIEDRIITVNEYFYTVSILGGLAFFVSSMNNKFMFCLSVDGHWMEEKYLKVFESCFKDILQYVCNE